MSERWRRVTIALALGAAACAAPEDAALRSLHAMGLHYVKIGGYPFFQCGDSDEFNSEFTATGTDGKRVQGAVCCGFLKNCTVRFK
jgi:hypothetical protein